MILDFRYRPRSLGSLAFSESESGNKTLLSERFFLIILMFVDISMFKWQENVAQ